MMRVRFTPALAVLGVSLLAATSPAPAAIDEKATEILTKMTAQFAAAERVSLKVVVAVQAGTQRQEMVLENWVQRPALFSRRISVDGALAELTTNNTDGFHLYAADVSMWEKTEQRATITEVLKMDMPSRITFTAPLLMDDGMAVLNQMFEQIAYGKAEETPEGKVHVLNYLRRGQSGEIRLRESATGTITPSQLQFMADGNNVKMQFQTVDLAPTFTDRTFAWAPPEEAREVPSIARAMMEQARAEQPQPLVGVAAPDFTLKDYDDKEVSLSSLRGKIVVLDFWASWCGPCRITLPVLTTVTREYKDKGVEFYAVNLRENKAKVSKFQTDSNLFFPVLFDRDGSVANAYKVEGIPHAVIIDKDGKIQSVTVGVEADMTEALRSKLDTLLAGKSLTQ